MGESAGCAFQRSVGWMSAFRADGVVRATHGRRIEQIRRDPVAKANRREGAYEAIANAAVLPSHVSRRRPGSALVVAVAPAAADRQGVARATAVRCRRAEAVVVASSGLRVKTRRAYGQMAVAGGSVLQVGRVRVSVPPSIGGD